MGRLEWRGPFAVDRSWFVQSEHVRGEGVCYFLTGLSYAEDDIRREHQIETTFYGRGGMSKAKRAAQTLADLLNG